jgi:hypothetical protein
MSYVLAVNPRTRDKGPSPESVISRILDRVLYNLLLRALGRRVEAKTAGLREPRSAFLANKFWVVGQALLILKPLFFLVVVLVVLIGTVKLFNDISRLAPPVNPRSPSFKVGRGP